MVRVESHFNSHINNDDPFFDNLALLLQYYFEYDDLYGHVFSHE